MTLLKAIILGIIQGITEFLPISSSGHLTIAQHFFEIPNLHTMIFFDLVCHLGTLLAIFIVYYETIFHIFKEKKLLKQMGLALLPLFPLVLLLKPIKEVFENPLAVGALFILNSLILFLGIHLAKTKKSTKPNFSSSFLVGMAQAVAVLPGISRSGSTISMAKGLGWSSSEAIRFSFLLAIPTICGAIFLELIKSFKESSPLFSLPFHYYVSGFTTAFIVGYGSLLTLQKIAKNNKFSYFAWYSLFLGLLTLLYF